jgi:hypothetical protein
VDCISANDIGNYTCHFDNSDDYEQGGVERSVFLNLTGKYNICLQEENPTSDNSKVVYSLIFSLSAHRNIQTLCTRHVTKLGHNKMMCF